MTILRKVTNPVTVQLCTPSLSLRRSIAVFDQNNMNLVKHLPRKESTTRICTNENILFRNGQDKFLDDLFPDAKILFLNNCDKNFMYYNMNRKIFPKVEKIFSNSHPYDYSLMSSFGNNNPEYVRYITPRSYRHHLHRWWEEYAEYIQEITYENYEAYFNTFDQVEPTWRQVYPLPKSLQDS